MEKLDRLGWAAGFSFVSYGVKVGVRFNNPELAGLVQPLLPPGWKPSTVSTVDRLYSVFAGGKGSRQVIRALNLVYGDEARIARTASLEDALESFESDLQLYIAEKARRRVFVHAGVVEWSNKAIIIPGRSFSGKTTLVAELVRAGARFYSDEYAVFDDSGGVHAYPKPLALRDSSGVQTKCPPESLGGMAGHARLRARLVVVSSFKPGAKWKPRIASAGDGVLALLANTVAARSKPEASLNALRRAIEGAVVLVGPRGEAREIAASILEEAGCEEK